MTARERARILVQARRAVQGAFLLLFVLLLLSARAPAEGAPSSLLGLFFDLDPLVLLTTWISTHAIEGLSLLALVTVGVTALLGRVFCGWFCPLGTLHNMITSIRSKKSRLLAGSDAFSPWQRAKYFLLVGLVAMALFGAHWIGVLDPFSLFYRSVTTAILPAVQYAGESAATAVFRADPRAGSFALTGLTEPVYRFFRDDVFVAKRAAFAGSLAIFLVFVAVTLLSLHRVRFWCRYVCPLGALLGLAAKRTPLRLGAAGGECGGCDLCRIACPAAAQPERPGEWLPTECFGCWNCVAACRQDAIDFHWESPLRRPNAGSVDLTRRALLTSALGGAGGFLALRLTPHAQGRMFEPALIRPPGARAETDFLDRCVQCGMCMKACPTNALHPTTFAAGLEGIWTPVLVPRLGYCEYECHLCGEVCPTGAIRPLSLPDKKAVRIGLAVFDTARCLPYAFGKNCIVCEEHCPIPTKAIYFSETSVRLRDGSSVIVKQPQVDPELCTGCGICENVCPFRDRAAVRVTSANESRHPGNRPFLPSSPGEGTGGGEGESAYGEVPRS